MSSHGQHSSSSATTPQKLLPALHHALSGSTGTLISTCALYPLSLIITRLQVQRQLRREGKLASPSPSPSATQTPHSPPPPHTTQAGTGDPLRGGEGAEGRSERGPHRRLQGQQQQEYAGIVDAFWRIWNSDGGAGPRAFYTGLVQDAAKSVLDSFLFFLFYEWFRSMRLGSSRKRKRRVGGSKKSEGLGVLEELAIGMVAGACSRAFTTPIANVVTRKQMATLVDGSDTFSSSASEGRGENVSVRKIAESIQREKGISGFWAGYSASLILTLNPSITFFLQEFLKKAVLADDDHVGWDDPGPRLTFLLAASSKAISSLITYPFQIAKTRLQVASGSSPSEEGNEEATEDKDVEEGGQVELVDLEPKPEAESEAEDQGAETVQPETSQQAAGAEASTGAIKKNANGVVHQKINKKLEAVHAVHAVRKFAARQSIFGTLAEIVRAEGVGALYDGVQAELLKGFFSHGTTMLAKDVVHKLFFKLYFFVATVLAEVRVRRARRREQTELQRDELLPRALRFQVDDSRNKTTQGAQGRRGKEGLMERGVRIVANIVKGTQRGVDKE